MALADLDDTEKFDVMADMLQAMAKSSDGKEKKLMLRAARAMRELATVTQQLDGLTEKQRQRRTRRTERRTRS